MVKNLLANAGDVRDGGLIPGSGRSPGERKGQRAPVFLSGESHGRAWRAAVHRVLELDTTEVT